MTKYCKTDSVSSRMCILGTKCCTVDHSALETAKYYKGVIKDMFDEIDLLFKDMPNPETGAYFHLIFCNGSFKYPIDPNNGSICNCKNTAFIKRIKKQAIEEYLKTLDKHSK